MVYGHLVHVGETLSDLQIWECELHKNAFSIRALPGPAGELYPRPPSCYTVGEEGRGREGLETVSRGERGGKGRNKGAVIDAEGRGREEAKGGKRVRKGERVLHLDICQGPLPFPPPRFPSYATDDSTLNIVRSKKVSK